MAEAEPTLTGWCGATGNHARCPAFLPELDWPDPARKGARYKLPRRRCTCTCHSRDSLKSKSR